MNNEVRHQREDCIQDLKQRIKNVPIAMLTTVDQEGFLRSRPMATQRVDFDGDLWFFTENDAPKIQELQSDRRVNLSFADPDENVYVSVSGKAELVHDTDKMRELWSPAYRAWFPEGLDDPHLGLMRVRVEKAEYWDSPSSKAVLLAGFIKATVTGKKFEPGENRKIDLAG